ncbi:trimeric intracellular cation channel family protein [Nitratifractor sp.]
MLLLIAEYLGIAAFALSGFYIAARHRLDLLGIYLSAFLTALGGGILRDLLADRPPLSLTQSAPALTVLAVTTFLVARRMHRQEAILSKGLFVFIDALGMVSFALSGAMVGAQAEFNAAGITLLAFTTAVGGGILRDVLINQVPYVLHGGFYGIIAIGLGIVVALLDGTGWLNTLTLLLLFIGGVVLRMIAWRRDWRLAKLD